MYMDVHILMQTYIYYAMQYCSNAVNKSRDKICEYVYIHLYMYIHTYIILCRNPVMR